MSTGPSSERVTAHFNGFVRVTVALVGAAAVALAAYVTGRTSAPATSGDPIAAVREVLHGEMEGVRESLKIQVGGIKEQIDRSQRQIDGLTQRMLNSETEVANLNAWRTQWQGDLSARVGLLQRAVDALTTRLGNP